MAALDSSITPQQARENKVIYRAMRLLEGRLRKPGEAMSGTSTVREFLALRLAQEEREIFAALWLDGQHRLIEVDDLFMGTLTQTSVYPREVVKRAMQLNAAAVILVHNHPSGVDEPSQSARLLTDALKQALSFVEVKVLDHFIVAGVGVMSFAERGFC